MKTIADKITELGGELAGPASSKEIAHLESRLNITLPEELRTLLRKHNGSLNETKDGIWRFWPCAEITTYQVYRGRDDFHPNDNALQKMNLSATTDTLPSSRLILFADALIDLPTYGVFHLPGHPYHGMVFDTSMGILSALSFGDWIAAFIDRGENCLLLPD